MDTEIQCATTCIYTYLRFTVTKYCVHGTY